MKTWQLWMASSLIAVPMGLAGCNEDRSQAVRASAVQAPPQMAAADFHEALTYSPEMVADSAEIALNEMALANVQKTFTAGTGLVTGQLPDGRKVIVQIASRAPSSDTGTDLGITIAGRTDSDVTRIIESHIMAALARGGTAQTPTPRRDAEVETEHMTK